MKPSIRSYLLRRVVLVVGVFCIVAGVMWSQGGISESDLARITADPAMTLSFPVRSLTIETGAGQQIPLKVEVAATPGHWQQGLMYRSALADDAGMIFLMGQPPRVVSFWMKNTLIALDMVFIGADGRIARIHENAQPGDITGISSEVEVVAVLELGGGRARALGLQTGDKIIFEGL